MKGEYNFFSRIMPLLQYVQLHSIRYHMSPIPAFQELSCVLSFEQVESVTKKIVLAFGFKKKTCNAVFFSGFRFVFPL